MGSPTQEKGSWGENVAAWYLRKKGYLIIKKHYTARFGEIDVVARHNTQTVFIEVKLRLGKTSGLPEQAIDNRKQKRLKKTILSYLSQNRVEDFRVDVVAISRGTSEKSIIIRHHIAVSDMF
jgi:putative endonuclease